MSPPSDPPKRRKASEVIREHAHRLFDNLWPGGTDRVERARVAARSSQMAAEAWLDEEQQRREAFERDVLERLRQLEKHAHTHPNLRKAGA